MSTTLDFTTVGTSTSYTIVEISTGVTTTDYVSKQFQIVSADGTTLFNSPIINIVDPSVNTTIVVPVTTDWTTHLGIVSVQVNMFYYDHSLNGTTVFHTYALPTLINTKVN